MATPPRQVLPGTTYLVSRRCSERRRFLRPSRALNDIFLFVLAVAAERYGVLVHAYCVMSNHFHLVVTDVEGRLPDFHQYLDGLVARAVNCAIRHSESFWDPESFSAIPLLTPEDVFAKMVYVLANPVAAGLVRHGAEWPGLRSDPGRIGETLTAVRPGAFFRTKGTLPRSEQITLHPPPMFSDDASFRRKLEHAVQDEENRLAKVVEAGGRRFLGRDRVAAQDPFGCPVTPHRKSALKPRIAGADPVVRAEALRRLREFCEAYREALAAWRAGVRDVLFPPGTWAMRVRHGARCAPAT